MSEVVDMDGVTLDSLEQRRQELGVTMSDLSRLLGYSMTAGWSCAIQNDSISTSKLRKAAWVLDYVEDHGTVPDLSEMPPEVSDEGVPDIDELEERRDELGVSTGQLSLEIGYESRGGWWIAVNDGMIADEKLREAERVLDHIEEHGRLPSSGAVPGVPGGGDE